MTPSIKLKYKRRGKAPLCGTSSLRRSPRRSNKNSSTTPSLPTATSASSSSSPDSTKTQNPENPLSSFAKMVLEHEKSKEDNPPPPPDDAGKLSMEVEPSPEKATTSNQMKSEAAEGGKIKKDRTKIEVINLEEIDESSIPTNPPAAATVDQPPTSDGTQPEVKTFDLNEPPPDSMKVVGDFEQFRVDTPYYNTIINGRNVTIYKPPHLYVKNPSLAKPISEKSSFDIGSGSRNPSPTVVTTADRHGLTLGPNTRHISPPIDAVPLQSRPPATGTLFDYLGLNDEIMKPREKPRLTPHQMSLINTFAKSTPGGPSINFSIPFSPPPTGGVKRPSRMVFKEPPSMKKPFKEQTINHIEFQAWKLSQERLRQEAVEKAEKRVYTQLWGTVMTLQKQCMDYNKKIMDLEQQLADSGLSDFEKKDRIDNLEMLLGLAIKSLKMDARELMELKNKEKGKTCEGENNKFDSKECSMHEIKFGSFTPEELNVLHGKERLMQLNHLLQKVGGGVGCSELAVVTEGCCNRLVVSGKLENLEDLVSLGGANEEKRKETENRKEEGETAEGSSSKEEKRKKEKETQDGDCNLTTTTKPACYPTPGE